MQINLSWDLFIIVFFTIIIAYSFIIGRNQTLKVIISTYIAILTADGIGNIIEKFISPQVINIVFPRTDFLTAAIIIKILIFVFVIVILAMKGKFEVESGGERSPSMSMIVSALFGVLSAGLIISTILFYMSGGSFLQPSFLGGAGAISSIRRGSLLIGHLIDYYNLWFSMPAIVFALTSFVRKAE